MTVVLFGANDTCKKLIEEMMEPFYVFDSFRDGKINGVKIYHPSQTDVILSATKIIVCSVDHFDQIISFLKMIGVSDTAIFSADSDANIVNYQQIKKFRSQSVLVVTMPKSGTVWLLVAIKEAARYRSLYANPRLVNRHNFYDINDIDELDLKKVCRNNEIIVGHLYCNKHNFNILRNAVLNENLKIVINWRDPRQALLSWVHHIDKLIDQSGYDLDYLGYPSGYNNYSFEEKITCNIDGIFHNYIEWVKSWKQVFESDFAEHCLFVAQETLVNDPTKYKGSVCDYLGAQNINLDRSPSSNQYHFRKGSTDEWRSVCNSKQIETMNDLLEESGVLHFITDNICNA
jgi:hypothetical protein